MSTRRLIVACVLLVVALSATPAQAAPNSKAAALAQERYYSSYGTEPGSAAALAQERYYSSYGRPGPLAASPPVRAPSNSPLLPIALIAGTLVLMGASATQVRRFRKASVTG
jgi:hypothetical protein